MRSQTFQQRRIVQLSKQIDQLKDKNIKLTEQNRQQYQEIKKLKQQQQSLKNNLIDKQSKIDKLNQQLRQANQSISKLQQLNKDIKDKKQAIELENVRQRQKLDQLKQQLQKYQSKMKDLIFQKQKQLATQQKQNYKLREQNIQVQKLYLKNKDSFQKKQQQHVKSVLKLLKDVDNLKNMVNTTRNDSISAIDNNKKDQQSNIIKIYQKIGDVEKKIEEQKKLKQEIAELRIKLQDVVTENSQKIIQIYKYKNLL